VLAVGCDDEEPRAQSAAGAPASAAGCGGDSTGCAGATGGATAVPIPSSAGQGGGATGAGRSAGAPSAGAAGVAAQPDAGAAGSSAAADAGMPDAGTIATCTGCETYADPVLRANVQAAQLDALSGAASSLRNPGVLFAHNDRNQTDVFALDEQGAELARITLDVVVSDIEDMAVGPCPEGSCVYVADIGDNAAARAEYALLRFTEPEIARGGGVAELGVEPERFRFEYEDGSHNAEGLLVEPRSGAVYVVTKVAAGQPSSVYRLQEPLDPETLHRATKVADLTVPGAGNMPASAAAAHPCGLGFAIRTYDALYEFRIASGAAFEDAFGVTPTPLPAPDEPQSEALTYLPDGRGLLSTGEGAAAPIYQLLCP